MIVIRCTQTKEGVDKDRGTHEVYSSAKGIQDMATSVSVAQKLESAYVFIVPLAQAILRWHVKQM